MLEPGQRPEFDLKEVLELVTDAFTGATERHIEVGDGLEMLVVENGKKMRWITLRTSAPSIGKLSRENTLLTGTILFLTALKRD